MIAPPSCWAMRNAAADLPLAVGPAIRTAFSSRPPRSPLDPSMSFVATLISHPAERALSASLVDMASRRLNATDKHWLADSLACDGPLPPALVGSEAEAIAVDLRRDLAAERIDLVLQPLAGRAKRLL